MKKLNKKGFTIVELVIVIAVIGILSAVLIPTFSNLTEKAQKSAAEQTVANEYKEWLIDFADKDTLAAKELIVEYEDYYFEFDGNKFVDCTVADTENDGLDADDLDAADYIVLTNDPASDPTLREICGDNFGANFTVYYKAPANQ